MGQQARLRKQKCKTSGNGSTCQLEDTGGDGGMPRDAEQVDPPVGRGSACKRPRSSKSVLLATVPAKPQSSSLPATNNDATSVSSAVSDACGWGLSQHLCTRLADAGIRSFFAVQRVAIPAILRNHYEEVVRDVAVSAATGSGKTLMYVLPIIHVLSKCIVRRLRALILLPTRDLAIQVKAVFDFYVSGTGLRVGLAIGQSNFAEEQYTLVGTAIPICRIAHRVVV